VAAVYKQKRHLSQNFLHDRQLVKRLVDKSSIGKKDTVVEIGPGKGIITLELAEKSRQVLTIEKDKRLIELLKNNLPKNVVLFNADGLRFPIPASSYKVFSNPPFSIQGKLFRKFIHADNPPQELCTVIRKRTALRWGGINKHSQFSIIHGPWFKFSIIHQFKPRDFKPPTKVNPVLLKVNKREAPLIHYENKKEYREFIKQGFGGGRRLKQNLSPYFSSYELNTITQDIGISINAKPTEVGLLKWIKLFKRNR
jgi:23S rRNA (adenine-N6)-dimethyltransferase